MRMTGKYGEPYGWYFLWGVLALSFILVGGWMIGSASAHSNQVEHEREIQCLKEGGRMQTVDRQTGLVCQR